MKSHNELLNSKKIFILIFNIIVQVKCNNFTSSNGTGIHGGNGKGQGSTEEFKGPAAWLRICEPGPGKYIGAVSAASKDACSSGYWFKKPTKIGCACGHGVWVFAKGWCDHTARIIIAKDGSCFNVNKDVRFIRNIGWGSSAFMPYHFVSTTGLEYIQDLPPVMTMPDRATNFHTEYNQHIGAIFRERGVESMSGRFCLSQDGNVSRALAFKYFVPKQPYYEKRSCFAYANQDTPKMEYDFGFKVYEGLTLIDGGGDDQNQNQNKPITKPKNWVGGADHKKCSTECPAEHALIIRGAENNSFAPEYNDPMVDEYFLEEIKGIGWTPDDNNTVPDNLPEQNCSQAEYVLSNKTMTELLEQTRRMIRLNIKSSVKSEPAPRVKYGDYRLLQKARTILAKVCPEAELPPIVLTGLHRMFRIAVNESFFHYPFVQLGPDNETDNIWSILDTCSTDSKPMTFKFANSTNSSSCSAGKFLGVNYEFKTNTTSLNRTILAKLPRYLCSNITELDLVVETAWKTVMFTHYYCARHFRDNALGFSVFEQKMERFFNRWIQHRWFYPGLSLPAYRYIYQMFNLERFAKALDRCVAAARSFSVYRKWIRRPTYTKFMGGKLFEEQYEIPDEIAGRTKLDAINPKLNQFNKKAYCLPYWHAPASNPGLNYNPSSDYKPGCVKYMKEEWADAFTPRFGKPNGWRNTMDISTLFFNN